MSEHVADQSKDTSDFKDPKLGWIIAFLFVVSFLGLFSVVPLRKVCHILEILILHSISIFHNKLVFTLFLYLAQTRQIEDVFSI
jgi:hypothetical protein